MKQLTLAAAACMTLAAHTPAISAGEIDLTLQDIMAAADRGEVISTLVFLQDQGGIPQLKQHMDANRMAISRRNEEVVRTLRDTAAFTQQNLLEHVQAARAAGQVADVQPYWIANVIRVDATADVLRQIAAHPDVLRMYYNAELEGALPVAGDDAGAGAGGGDAGTGSAIEPGIIAIRADEVWELGFTGEGVLVASLDTGVDGNHPAIASRWRGLDPAYAGNPEWAWFDPRTFTTFPAEFHWSSHGTHTMGTICGGAPGDQVGVAPGAEWIHAAVIDRVNIPTTVADAILSFQWMVDPDGNPSTFFDVPDVCSNSWGVTTGHGYPNCDDLLWSFIDNAEAAGIIMLFSAGNEGSGGLRRPADRATDEYRSVAVASVNANVSGWPLSSFSSLGPTFCTITGEAATKPDISAPGDGIRSAVSGGGYDSKSGTSMASPHVNGVAALMRQACPDITPDEVKQIMYDSAIDLGAPGKDNSYGYGMIDAYEAVQATIAACRISLVLPAGAPSLIDSGVAATFPVRITDGSETVVPGSEVLVYRINGGAFTTVALTNLGGGEYTATLPAVNCDDILEFYVRAEGDGGAVRTSPPDAPASLYSPQIGQYVTNELLHETFSGGMPAGWSADGLWNVTSQCPITGDCGGSQWAYYGDPGTCTYETAGSRNFGEMLSSPIALPDVPEGGVIKVEFCYNLETEASTAYDIATFGILGGSSTELSDAGSWATFSADVTAHAGETVTLRWHFDTGDGLYNNFHGWQIGEVRVIVTSLECDDTAPACDGDLNGDGTVNVGDMLLLLNDWGSCPGCASDLNDDGNVNVGDLLILLAAWGSCP